MYPSIIAGNISRLVGLVAFFLFFILLLVKFLGFKSQGKQKSFFDKIYLYGFPLVYIVAFLHPIIYLVSIYLAGGKLDPYLAFVNACLICKTPEDYYLTLGRISFWALTTVILAVVFRKSCQFFKKYEEKIQIVNYFAFFLIGIHAILLGSYIKIIPVLIIASLCYLVILYIFLFHEAPKLLRDFQNWLKS